MQRYFLENFASTSVPIGQYQCIPKIGGCWACSGEELCLWIYTTLPFRLRSAPKIFTALADAAECIARRRGVQFCIHYLDDYLDDYLIIGLSRETVLR